MAQGYLNKKKKKWVLFPLGQLFIAILSIFSSTSCCQAVIVLKRLSLLSFKVWPREHRRGSRELAFDKQEVINYTACFIYLRDRTGCSTCRCICLWFVVSFQWRYIFSGFALADRRTRPTEDCRWRGQRGTRTSTDIRSPSSLLLWLSAKTYISWCN